MDQMKRIKRSEATWRELFARHASSGISVLEFCRAEGINPGVFRRWRSTLNGGGMQAARTQARASAKVVTPFIDIGAVGAGQSRFEVRLEFGGGVVLTVARG
jgi:transposase-like protein